MTRRVEPSPVRLVSVTGRALGALLREVEVVAGLPMLRADIDRAAIARLGLDPRDVADAIEAIGGHTVTEVVKGRQRFVGRAFGGTLLGIATWTVACAVLGPDRLAVVPSALSLEVVGWLLFGAALLLVIVAQAQMGRSWRIGIDDRPTGS